MPIFEGIAGSPGDLDALNELEGLTSSRLREQAGHIHMLKAEDRRFGPGWSPIMAAICYPRPSRFTDGTFGVYYCADNERTAVVETRYHRERFLAESREAPIAIEMRVYIAEVDGELLDLRDNRIQSKPYLDPRDWTQGQRLGSQVRAADKDGLVYPSVRDHRGGECAAIMRPPALGPARQGKHFEYRWNGERISDVVEIRRTAY